MEPTRNTTLKARRFTPAPTLVFRGFGGGRLCAERQLLFIRIKVYIDGRRRTEALRQNFARHRVFNEALNGALQRTRARRLPKSVKRSSAARR